MFPVTLKVPATTVFPVEESAVNLLDPTTNEPKDNARLPPEIVVHQLV